MTVLYLRRVGYTLHGDGEESVCQIGKLALGKTLRAEVKQPRNAAFHRLFFALCHRIGDGIGQDAEAIATVFKLAAGHYDIIRTKSYGDVKVPKSISFAKMDETSFREFFEECIRVAFAEWRLDPMEFSDLLDPKTERHQ